MPISMKLGFTQKLIDSCKEHSLLRNQAAYVLATAYHETAHTMKPVVEAYWLSEAWRKKNLRYYPWHGRGFVQITWETNYKKAGEELNLDLTTNPDVVLDPDISADIAVLGMKYGWFTKKKLSDYITLQNSDFRNARKIINAMDKADLIAGYAKDYDNQLKKLGYN